MTKVLKHDGTWLKIVEYGCETNVIQKELLRILKDFDTNACTGMQQFVTKK